MTCRENITEGCTLLLKNSMELIELFFDCCFVCLEDLWVEKQSQSPLFVLKFHWELRAIERYNEIIAQFVLAWSLLRVVHLNGLLRCSKLVPQG